LSFVIGPRKQARMRPAQYAQPHAGARIPRAWQARSVRGADAGTRASLEPGAVIASEVIE
jgi:hypothetical protein